MIKINLLPHASAAKTSNTEKQILAFVFSLVIITAGIFSLGLWSGARVSELDKMVQEKLAQRQAMLSIVTRINQMQKEIDEIQSNIAAIKDVRLRQQLPVIYMEETVRCLPEEKIWFQTLELSEQGILDIRGVALDNQVFAGYVDELRNSAYVRSVSTQRTSSRQIMDLDLVEFQFQVRAGPKTFGQE